MEEGAEEMIPPLRARTLGAGSLLILQSPQVGFPALGSSQLPNILVLKDLTPSHAPVGTALMCVDPYLQHYRHTMDSDMRRHRLSHTQHHRQAFCVSHL